MWVAENVLQRTVGVDQAMVSYATGRATLRWDPTRVRLGSRWVEVLSWAGPWRRTGRWWDGQAAADRYQVVTSAGAFLCEVIDGEAFVTGVYD